VLARDLCWCTAGNGEFHCPKQGGGQSGHLYWWVPRLIWGLLDSGVFARVRPGGCPGWGEQHGLCTYAYSRQDSSQRLLTPARARTDLLAVLAEHSW